MNNLQIEESKEQENTETVDIRLLSDSDRTLGSKMIKFMNQSNAFSLLDLDEAFLCEQALQQMIQNPQGYTVRDIVRCLLYIFNYGQIENPLLE